MLYFFRRLQWRMTISYILVTIPAIVVIQACFLILIGLVAHWFINSELLAEDQAIALALSAPEAASYLDQAAPDQEGLLEWLKSTMYTGGSGPAMFPKDTYPPVLLNAIVNTQGDVIADATGTLTPATALTSRLNPQAVQVLQAALNGQTAPELLTFRQADNGIIAATPIKAADQRVLGAWLVHVGPIPFFTREQSVVIMIVFLVPLSILAALCTVMLGAIYGSLIARSLVERLRSLSLAANAWSAGDFRVLVRDTSADEIGNLSRQLNHMAEQIQTLLATRQELAALEERNRLARDLHDSVKQQLFAISMHLASARTLLDAQKPVDTLLEHAEALTEQAQQELTATIHALRPAALHQVGLFEALRVYTAEWSAQHPITTEFQSQGQRELPLQLEQVLFRVAQEALSNIARHSSATRLTIQLSAERHLVELSIIDNGRGFLAQVPHERGMGLQSMRERVASSGGTLTIESLPGKGTHITASMPIHQGVTQ